MKYPATSYKYLSANNQSRAEEMSLSKSYLLGLKAYGRHFKHLGSIKTYQILECNQFFCPFSCFGVMRLHTNKNSLFAIYVLIDRVCLGQESLCYFENHIVQLRTKLSLNSSEASEDFIATIS